MMSWLAERSAASLPAKLLERAARFAAWAVSPWRRRTRETCGGLHQATRIRVIARALHQAGDCDVFFYCGWYRRGRRLLGRTLRRRCAPREDQRQKKKTSHRPNKRSSQFFAFCFTSCTVTPSSEAQGARPAGAEPLVKGSS